MHFCQIILNNYLRGVSEILKSFVAAISHTSFRNTLMDPFHSSYFVVGHAFNSEHLFQEKIRLKFSIDVHKGNWPWQAPQQACFLTDLIYLRYISETVHPLVGRVFQYGSIFDFFIEGHTLTSHSVTISDKLF